MYTSPNIIRVIKSRRMILTRHVAHMREKCIEGFVWKTEGK